MPKTSCRRFYISSALLCCDLSSVYNKFSMMHGWILFTHDNSNCPVLTVDASFFACHMDSVGMYFDTYLNATAFGMWHLVDDRFGLFCLGCRMVYAYSIQFCAHDYVL